MNKIQLEPREILKIINFSLAERFFRDAKKERPEKLFALLCDDKKPWIIDIKDDDEDKVNCLLELDKSGYQGELDYASFQSGLASTLHHVSDVLTKGTDINLMQDAENGDLLFNIPGVVKNDNQVNLMVLGVSTREVGKLTVRIHFLDPEQ